VARRDYTHGVDVCRCRQKKARERKTKTRKQMPRNIKPLPRTRVLLCCLTGTQIYATKKTARLEFAAPKGNVVLVTLCTPAFLLLHVSISIIALRCCKSRIRFSLFSTPGFLIVVHFHFLACLVSRFRQRTSLLQVRT